MGYKKISGIIGLILLCAWLGALPVQATHYTWSDGNGNWSTDGNWDIPGFPNGSGDSATINNGSTIALDNLSPYIGGLQLASGNTLNITNQQLFLVNATVTNNGIINLINPVSYLTAYNSQSTLTGAGSVVLGRQLEQSVAPGLWRHPG